MAKKQSKATKLKNRVGGALAKKPAGVVAGVKGRGAGKGRGRGGVGKGRGKGSAANAAPPDDVGKGRGKGSAANAAPPVPPDDTGGEAPESGNKMTRKCIHSRGYYQGLKAAVDRGLGPEAAKACARESAKAAIAHL